MSMNAPQNYETYMVYVVDSLGNRPYDEINVAFDANLVLRLVEEGYIEESQQHHYEAYMTTGGYIIKAEGTDLETYFMEMVQEEMR